MGDLAKELEDILIFYFFFFQEAINKILWD